MLFPVIDIPQTNMTSTSNATLNYMKLGVLTRHQLRNLLQDEEDSLQMSFPPPLFDGEIMKSWYEVYKCRQWDIWADSLTLAAIDEEIDRLNARLERRQQKKEKRRLFHSYNMKSWRNVYTRRQWELHIDNLYEAMLADQVYQDTLDLAEYEAVHARMHGR